jgi:alkaline phosphatase D
MRSANTGQHEVLITGGAGGTKSIKVMIPAGQPGDKTLAVTYPSSTTDTPLAPLTKYKYQIIRTSDRIALGEGSFETSPAGDADTPQKVVIALISCHQPFSNRGVLDPLSSRMLSIVPKVLKENNVKFIIPCGDQIYADDPEIFSLFDNPYLIRQVVPGKTSIYDCTENEVRQIYDRRYRTLWSMKSIRDMYANYPCYPIMDDHEIKNSWGAQPEHSTPRFANIYKGALSAYFDYQASNILPQMPHLPGSFHYNFSYGNIGVFVMDIRSERFSDSRNQLFSQKQLADLSQFLVNNASKKVLFIVSSVPVFFVPDGLADIGVRLRPTTFNDHWSQPNNIPSRNALLNLLYTHRLNHPNQIVAILSGDVHIGNACGIHIQGLNAPLLYQFTSSPLTVNENWSTKTQVRIAPRLATTSSSKFNFPCTQAGEICEGSISKLPGVKGASHNPVVNMNIGLIEVQRSGDVSKLKFKLISYHPTDDRPVTYFESNWLE